MTGLQLALSIAIIVLGGVAAVLVAEHLDHIERRKQRAALDRAIEDERRGDFPC